MLTVGKNLKKADRSFVHTFITFALSVLLFISYPEQISAGNLRSMKYTDRSKKEALAWQYQLRTEFTELLNMNDLIAGRERIPLDIREISSETKSGFILKELEINSTPGRRIRVILALPSGEKNNRPAVVSIHGHGGKILSVYDEKSIYKGFATELARSGYVTVAPVVSQHVISENGRTLMGERLWDAMRCVDLLESLPEVNKNRIGCAGLSLGGEMAMWLGAMDTRIKATLSSGFLTVMDQMEKNHCQCWKFPGLRERADWADVYSLVAPRALMCQNGLKEPANDFTVPLAKKAMEEIKLIYSDYGKPQNVSLAVHGGAHEIDLPSLMKFFKTKL